MNLKQKLFNSCLKFIDNRRSIIQSQINEIKESLHSETKSSAGDKHETGRAMLQLEREKLGHQLMEVNKLNNSLSKINVDNHSKMVCLGSVVYTTQANYYIAISAGVFVIDNESYYAISPQTPIAQLLLSQSEGAVIAFRDKTFAITKIY